MEPPFNPFKSGPDADKAMRGAELYLRSCGLEESLLHLVKLRASQTDDAPIASISAGDRPRNSSFTHR
jgi:hypothetical protein